MRAYRIGDRVRVLKVIGVGPGEDARCANTVGVIAYGSECSDGIGYGVCGEGHDGRQYSWYIRPSNMRPLEGFVSNVLGEFPHRTKRTRKSRS